MNRTFAVYEAASGRIRRVLHIPESWAEIQELAADEAIMSVAGQTDDIRHWIDPGSGKRQTRPRFNGFDKRRIAADGADTARMEGLPEGQVVEVDGERITVDDGVLEIAADTPDVYRVRIPDADAFPYRSFEVEIVAK